MDRTDVARVKEQAIAWADRLSLLLEAQELAQQLGFRTEMSDIGSGELLNVTLLSGERSVVLSVTAFDVLEFIQMMGNDAKIDEDNFVEIGLIVDGLVLEPSRVTLSTMISRPAKEAITSMLYGFKGIRGSE